MLSRNQFKQVQIARGLSMNEIIARTGIPAQAFVVLMNDTERDPSKLISAQTFETLEQVLGLKAGMSGLRDTGVIEWRVPAKSADRQAWLQAVESIRADMMGDQIGITVMSKQGTMFSKQVSAVFLFDADSRVKIVITHADRNTQRAILRIFGAHDPRMVNVEPAEYDLTCNLVANSVYRTQQFMIVLGGRQVRYTWSDVQAAAKEFNFTTDDLIEMMVRTVDEARNRAAVVDPAPAAVDIPVLRVAVAG